MSEHLAIAAHQLTKDYTLYPNKKAQALDLLGFYKLFPKRSQSFATFSALKKIDLHIEKGARYGIVGRNGSGKSTLMKLLIGCLMPSSGTLTVNGRISALMNIGLGFHPELTGRENIESSLLYNQLTDQEREEAYHEIIEFCELKQFIDQPFKAYSLGMRSRLQFACATAIKPDILLIDEVLSAGDAYFSEKTANRVRQLVQTGCTFLLISHSDEQILQFCDRAIWLDQGEIKAIGSSSEVIQTYRKFIDSLKSSYQQTELETEDLIIA